MKEQAIVVDIDNTVIDTAVRKRAILAEMFKGSHQNVLLENVRQDYMLNTFLGEGQTANRLAFMEILSSTNGIQSYPAPAFSGAVESLQSIGMNDVIKIVYITGRSEALRQVTIEELNQAIIPIQDENLRMLSGASLDTRQIDEQVTNFKKKEIEELLEHFDVIANIGDRPDDFEAARQTNIPFILFKSTLSESEIKRLQSLHHVGFFVHTSWHTIPTTIKDLQEAANQLRDIRNSFCEQYALFLGQLDTKCGILIALAGGLATLGGYIILEELKSLTAGLCIYNWCSFILIAIEFILAFFALFFGIKGYTSRTTSGVSSGRLILVRLQQAYAILFGKPEAWSFRKDDAIDEFDRIKKAPLAKQARSHYDFLFKRYKTYDPEAINNLRLYELRATNYQKVYAERFGSILAIGAIVFIIAWLVLKGIRLMF